MSENVTYYTVSYNIRQYHYSAMHKSCACFIPSHLLILPLTMTVVSSSSKVYNWMIQGWICYSFCRYANILHTCCMASGVGVWFRRICLMCALIIDGRKGPPLLLSWISLFLWDRGHLPTQQLVICWLSSCPPQCCISSESFILLVSLSLSWGKTVRGFKEP